jgi:hypothetical protein
MLSTPVANEEDKKKPIALMEVIYRIVFGILANQLQRIMNNILLTYSLIYKMHSSK